MTLERHISNTDNWAITTKVFIILHRALQNIRINKKVIKDLKLKEHLLHHYNKKGAAQKYSGKMYLEISKMYSTYLKYYINVCYKTEILARPLGQLSGDVRKLKNNEIFKNYEYFEAMVT